MPTNPASTSIVFIFCFDSVIRVSIHDLNHSPPICMADILILPIEFNMKPNSYPAENLMTQTAIPLNNILVSCTY